MSRLKDPQLRVVDCRFSLLDPKAGRRDYLQGHIPSAVYADLDQDLAAPISAGSGRHPLPEVSVFKGKLEAWGIGAGTRVVVYDQHNGVMASRLWWMLQWLGHADVSLLEGGYDAWVSAGQPLEAGQIRHEKSEFQVRLHSEMVVTTQEILSGVERGDLPILLDAREHERFLGQIEPIDTHAGHIPGAVNMPFALSQTGDSRWLPRDELRALWKRVLSPAGDGKWVTMCGSGVTACHLALSAQYAGFTAPRVYIGSWSEWIRDLRRPRETL